MLRFRKRLSSVIARLRLPPIALYLLLAVPLLIFEEQIDCQPSWCGAVAIPPTTFLVGGDAGSRRTRCSASREEPTASYAGFRHLRSRVRTISRRPSGSPYLDSRYPGSVRGDGLRVRIDAALIGADGREGPDPDVCRICSAVNWNAIVNSLGV